MNKKGFTLVELLAVIAILAILVLVAVPNVLGMFNNAKKDTFATETKDMIRIAQQQYLANFGKYTKYAVEGSITDDEKIQTITCTSTTGPSSVIKLNQKGEPVVKNASATDDKDKYEWSTTYCKIDKDAGNLTNFIITFEPSKGDVKTVTSTDRTYTYTFPKDGETGETVFDMKKVEAQ